jgi:hypothetical protein
MRKKQTKAWQPGRSLFVFHQQVILNNYRTIDKPFIYRFLHPWLGTGLLTATGKVSYFFQA